MSEPRRTRVGTPPRRDGLRRRRGGILLELLLSIALFVGAAVLVLDAMGGALDGVRRADLRARAMDLAQSRLAELDAGLVAIGELGGSSSEEGGDGSTSAADDLVVLLEIAPAPDAGDSVLARATVRVRVRGSSDEGAVVLVAERIVSLRERREGNGGAS